MMERLALALPVVLATALALWTARRRSPLAPTVIAVGVTAVIAVFFPLLSLLVEPMSWRHGVHLPDEYVRDAQWQYLAFAVGLCAVVARIRLVRRRRPPIERRRDPAQVRSRDQIVALGLVVGGALLYAVYVAKVGLGPLLDRSNFAEKYRVSSGLGTFYAGLNLMILGCLWAEASALPRRQLRLFRAVAAVIFIWAFAFLAVRTYAVALLFGHLYLFTQRRGFTVAKVRPSLVLALLLAFVGVEAYSLLRSVWSGSMSDAVVALQEELPEFERTAGQVVGGSELAHPFLSMMELARYELPGELAGESYAGAIAGLAPAWLVPDRPDSVAQRFAEQHYPELAERGGGTAFTLVGEAWWNVGSITGPLLIGLLVGWLLMWLERSARLDPAGIPSRILPYTLHMILLAHRISAPAQAKQVFILALPTALLLLGASLVWGAASRRAAAGGAPSARPLGPESMATGEVL